MDFHQICTEYVSYSAFKPYWILKVIFGPKTLKLGDFGLICKMNCGLESVLIRGKMQNGEYK